MPAVYFGSFCHPIASFFNSCPIKSKSTSGQIVKQHEVNQAASVIDNPNVSFINSCPGMSKSSSDPSSKETMVRKPLSHINVNTRKPITAVNQPLSSQVSKVITSNANFFKQMASNPKVNIVHNNLYEENIRKSAEYSNYANALYHKRDFHGHAFQLVSSQTDAINRLADQVQIQNAQQKEHNKFMREYYCKKLENQKAAKKGSL